MVIAYEQAHSFVRVSRAKRRMCPRLILLAGFAGVQLPNKWACSQARVVKCCGLTRLRLVNPQQILTTVTTCMVIDKTKHYAKPHSICFLPEYQRKKIFVLIIENSDSDLKVQGLHYASYYTFSSLTLFWLAESLQWIFEISTRDVMTNHVKDTQGHG